MAVIAGFTPYLNSQATSTTNQLDDGDGLPASLELSVNGSSLIGIPGDLRGTGAGPGGAAVARVRAHYGAPVGAVGATASGGTGGNGGAT